MEKENIIVQSKVKKLIKDKKGFSTSANFVTALSELLYSQIDAAMEHAKQNGRKTVMGRDFNFYVDEPSITEVLVVSSKIKRYIKESSGLATSAQVMDQLTFQVANHCEKAIEKAEAAKRKTVMDRDLATDLSEQL